MEQQAASALKKTYDETLDLMIEARNYLAYKAPRDCGGMAQRASLRASCEAFRITSRLTQVMAWLMAQRAVHAGELELEEACSERFRLSARHICLDDSAGADDELPHGLRSLLDRSLRLYERIARLDDMTAQRSRLRHLH